MSDDEPEGPEIPDRAGAWSRYRAKRKAGMSTRAIAASEGVSRAAVQQALRYEPPLSPLLVRDDGTRIPCHYCGMESQVLDRVRCAVSATNERGEMLTPACMECRRLASGTRERAMIKRKAAVKKRLRAIYGERLNVPNWEPSELAELSPEMRGFIQRALDMRDAVKDRLAW